MRPAILCAAALASALSAAAPLSAHGVERITATFLAEYGAESYTIDQGEIVTFANRDRFLSHGIASNEGPGSLFSAPVVARNQVRLLRGAPFLTAAGSPYTFHCPVHVGMTSVLGVTAAGAPLAPDAIKPGARVKIKTASLGKLTRKRTLRVVLAPGEAVDAALKATADGIVLGRAERTFTGAGRQAVAVPLSSQAAAALRRLARRGPVRLGVKVALSDVAGNRGKARARRDLGGGGGAKKKAPAAGDGAKPEPPRDG